MRLEGLSLLLAFALTVAYGLFVDLALFARIFRQRAALVVGSIVGLAVVFILLSQAASSSERTALLGPPAGAGWVVLVVTSAVLLPFIVIAPFAQYAALRHGRRWPAWISAWMVLQLLLLPGFLVLAVMEAHFQDREYAAGQALGLEAGAGGFGGILQLAEQRQDRIWGTGWAYPRRHKPTDGRPYIRSAWFRGLAKGLDGSAPIAADEALSEPDRAAVRTLLQRYFQLRYAVPNIRAKLVWDALEAGGFSRLLAPNGTNERSVVGEEVIPALLERFEKYGGLRLCPGGRMMDADRAVLNAVILKYGRVWNGEKRVYEMRPEWEGYRRRVQRLCRVPEWRAKAPPVTAVDSAIYRESGRRIYGPAGRDPRNIWCSLLQPNNAMTTDASMTALCASPGAAYRRTLYN